MAATGEILVLLLSNGMSFGELAAVIEELKNKSKGAGTHARRELFWQAYTKLAGKVSGMDGPAHCFLQYRAGKDGADGEAEIIELTKRQVPPLPCAHACNRVPYHHHGVDKACGREMQTCSKHAHVTHRETHKHVNHARVKRE